MLGFLLILYIVLNKTMNKDVITSAKAAKICGFESVYMIDYLQRSGVYVPSKNRRSGRGRRREYSFKDLVILRTIATLLKNGASVASLKNALVDFQGAKWEADRASMQFEGSVARYMIAVGGKVLFAKSEDRLYDLTQNGQMVFSFIIDLDRIHTEVKFAMDQQTLPMAGIG
jgi:DNA-binding transcriptional MerR regulator